MMKLINRGTRDYYRNKCIDSLTPEDEPIIEMREEYEQDYSTVYSVIDSLNLTDNIKVALECRMAGLSYPEIGLTLDRVQSTVYAYFIKMRARYTAIYR